MPAPMSDGEKDSRKSISHTRLSVAVPEFVPSRIAHNGLAPSQNLHVESNLSPLVPEFQPSVLLTPSSPVTSPCHSEKPINSNLSLLALEFCSSGSLTSPSTSLCETRQSLKQHGKCARAQKEHNGAWESDTNNSSDKSSVKLSQKKRQRKKKEFDKSIAQGENANLAGYPLIGNQSSSNKSQQEMPADKSEEDVKPKATSGLQQNCLLSSPNSSNDETSASNNTFAVHVASNTPTQTMSYSDKLKSQPPKQNMTSNHLDTKKAWKTNLTAESFNKKSKQEEIKKLPKYHDNRSKSDKTVNSNEEKNHAKKGNRDNDSSLETRWQGSEYDKLKLCGYTTKLQSANANQMNRNVRYQKADDDHNWRKKEFDGVRAGFAWSNQFEEMKRDRGELYDSKNKKTKTVKKSPNLNDLSSCRTGLGASANSDFDNTSPKHSVKEANNLSFNDQNIKIVQKDFPDLKGVGKMEKLSTVMEARSDQVDILYPNTSSAPLSYSAAVKSAPMPKVTSAWQKEQPSTPQAGILKVQPPLTINEVENDASQDVSSLMKNKKKKRKKTGVTGEQVKDVKTSNKRTQKPIYLELGDMIQETKAQKNSKRKGILSSGLAVARSVVQSPANKAEVRKTPLNILDSTAPLVKRGKEKECPGRKKPSRVKKIILKEREEKKKARETTKADNADQSWDDKEIDVTCKVEADPKDVILQEISENLSEDDTAEGVNGKLLSPTDEEIAAKIHSRRFREYCSQILDKDVDLVTIELLKTLVHFQDRQFRDNPIKAKTKRRLVLGLREVTKHLKSKRLKCVIISSNVERIRSEGGLDETLSSIIALCQENQVPLVFALKRQTLGKVLLKKVPVSIVGIFNYGGADAHFNKLIELTQRTRQAYTEKWEETREKLESQHLPGKNMTDLENNQSCEADNAIIDSIAEDSDDYGDDEVGGGSDSGGGNEEGITGNDLTIQDL